MGKRTRRRVWQPRLWLIGLGLAAAALAGCKSVSISPYVSPRVTGRVVAADTGQPLAKVKVQRLKSGTAQDYDASVKGGQRLESPPMVRTDEQGWFVLEAQRALTLLQPAILPSVTAAFEREGYVTLRTNFNLLQASTNTTAGPPVVNAGDIRLQPRVP